MQIDQNDHKELLAEILQKLRDVNTELTACKLSFSSLKTQCLDLEQRLEGAKEFPTLQGATHESCEIPLERFLAPSGQAFADWVLLQRLQALNASEPAN
jgi:hypothetical protein